jgi:predicted RNA-binding Zn ribbon-like protein
MGRAAREPGEWIDGFLFIAGRPILDFLNTRPVLEGEPKELLPDVAALARWLMAAGLLRSAKAKAMVKSWRHSAEAAALLRELRGFRERLREALLRIESGSPPSDEFLKEVNARLAQHPLHHGLRRRDGKLMREEIFEPEKPADFWTPLIHATADLLAEPETARLRKCESCVLHFFDTSKKGSRRWCSMNICGNKVKVAAYQRRKREA